MAKERLSKLQKWILIHCLEEVFLGRNEAREFYGKKFSCNPKIDSWPSESLEYRIKNSNPPFTPDEMKLYDITKEEHKTWNPETNRYDIPDEYTIFTPKSEYVSTKAEEVAISRSFKNLSDKEFITRTKKWGAWHLTEKGFLIAKNSATPCSKVNLKDDDTFIANKAVTHDSFDNFKDYNSKIEESEAANKKRLSEIEAAFRGVSRKDESPEKAEKRRQLRFKELEFQTKFTPHAIFSLCCDSCKKRIVEFEIECGANEITALMKELEAL